MSAANTIVTKEDYTRFMTLLDTLQQESNARFVFLLEKSGQHIAAAGEMDDVDPTSLASLTAGNVAATEGVAQLVGEDGFTTLFHEGRTESLHICVVADRLILLVVFNERSSLGLVRLRVEQCMPELTTACTEMLSRTASGAQVLADGSEEVGKISDADIDALFGK